MDRDARAQDGNTALMLAAEGEPQIVEALIEHGCDLNIQNSEGHTALMRAIQYEDEMIISMLLEAGARMDLYDNEHKCVAQRRCSNDARRGHDRAVTWPTRVPSIEHRAVCCPQNGGRPRDEQRRA